MKSIKYFLLLLVFVSFSIKVNSQLWKQYSDTAVKLFDSKKFDKAIEYYSKAIAGLKSDSAGTNTYARTCYNFANCYTRVFEYDKAESLYIEAKEIWTRLLGKQHNNYVICCTNLAILYINKSQFQKAVPLLLEAKEIVAEQKGKETLDYAKACNNIANLYTELGDFDKAEPLYLAVKKIREKILTAQHPEYASVCNNLAILYQRTGEYVKAESLYREAQKIRENVLTKEHPDYASTCNNLAGLYKVTGQFSKAESLYIEAKQIREKLLEKSHPDYAGVCDNLAGVYEKTGQYEKAEALYLEAREITKKVLGNQHLGYATSCNNLAGLYSRMGQYEKAETLYLEAKNIFEIVFGKQHFNYAMNCDNLAILYMKQDQMENAESISLEAREIYQSKLGNENSGYANNCGNLALIYFNTGRMEKAEAFYQEAMQIREKLLGKQHADYAKSCNDLALLYMSTGRYNKAETLFKEAKNITEVTLGKANSDYTINCRNLALLFWNLKDYKHANSFYKEAFNSQNIILKEMFQFTSETEKQLFTETVSSLSSFFYSFNTVASSSLSQGLAYAVSLADRNLILFSSQKIRSSLYYIDDAGIKTMYNEWINLREQLSFSYVNPVTQQSAHTKGLEEKANTLEKELTRLSADFKKEQSSNEITCNNIQQSLKTNEVSIEFIEFQYFNGKRWTDSTYYIALVLRRDKPEPELVRLFEKRQLDGLLNRRSQLIQGGNNFIDSLYQSKSAYNLIWQPLEKELKGISKVYFAPSGLLHRISFAAIPINSKEVLSDRYQLVQLNTTASVVKMSVNFLSASDKIILYGGVKYDADSTSLMQANQPYAANSTTSISLPRDVDRGDRGNIWKDLPASQEEINEIERLGKQKKMSLILFNKVNATEESIKSLNAKNSPSVLHIATHGFFFPDPEENKQDDLQTGFATSGKVFRQSDNPLFRSGLLFAGANNAWKGEPFKDVEDGILTAYEVSNLYLPNTRLVVLSACETGLGDIQGSEGVYGLQRSFKMAGVQNLVMSLWKVPDEATSEFMKLFYQNMFNKQTIADAFNNAQKIMKKKYRNNPYNWAAWILVR